MIATLLDDIYKPRNLCEILRTFSAIRKPDDETFKLFVHDPRKRLREAEEEGKVQGNGAYTNIVSNVGYDVIAEICPFLKEYDGRKVAIDIRADAVPLNTFLFRNKDLLIFGNERAGLDDRVLGLCDDCVVIPMFGAHYRDNENRELSLDHERPLTGIREHSAFNVSVAYGIAVLYALQQLGYFEGFEPQSLFSGNKNVK